MLMSLDFNLELTCFFPLSISGRRMHLVRPWSECVLDRLSDRLSLSLGLWI